MAVSTATYAREPVTDEWLRRVAAAIAGAVPPWRIVLFGSHASGKAGTNSDVDLLIVVDRAYGPAHDIRADYRRIYRALMPFRQGFDILLYDRAQFDLDKDDAHTVIGQAHAHGRVLYAA